MANLVRKLSPVVLLLAVPAGPLFAQATVSSSGQQPAGTLEQRVERMERMMQSQGLLEILQQVQQLQQDISLLRGEIETHNYNLDQLTRRQRDLYADMDRRLQQLEGGGTVLPADGTAGMDSPPLETLSAIGDTASSATGPANANNSLQVEVISSIPAQPAAANPMATPGAQAPVNTTQPAAAAQMPVTGQTVQTGAPAQVQADIVGMSATTPAATTATAPVSSDPVQLQAEYQQAFNLLRQSLYDQAIKAFQQFLTNHPNDRYSDNAQYWLAEAYFVKREFPLALEEYNKVITNFPESQKASDAMLKVGFTMIELGQIDNAREHLQSLIRQQPDSTVARLAEERLKQLGSATQQVVPEQAN
jgi:tol-pal system protein YbgF